MPRLLILLLGLACVKGLPFNQLTLCASASWNTSGVTMADRTLIGAHPNMIFIDTENMLYVTNDDDDRLRTGQEDIASSYRLLLNNLNRSKGIFLSEKGDIYIDNGAHFGRVEKWTANGTIQTIVMTVDASCHSLFVGPDDLLYCSLSDLHQVVARPLDLAGTSATLVAGACSSGDDIDQLYFPHGIFVTDERDLYVADCGNNRVQVYRSGQSTGTTVISNTTINSLVLRCPTSILFDNDGYMYILERDNHRIIRSDMRNFRCIVGCSGASGNALNQLNFPSSFSFDRNGHLWVIDRGNSRLQKFPLASNSCHLIHNFPRLSPCARWNAIARTWADRALIGSRPLAIFIDTNNSIYFAQRSPSIWRWFAKANQSTTWPITSWPTRAMFVASNGDIYVDNGDYGTVDRWQWNSSVRHIALTVGGSCYGIFLDIKETLYCSVYLLHQVVKKSFMDPNNATVIAAGNGTAGSALDRLSLPAGLFVDHQSNMYVAECGNNRVMRFHKNNLTGTAVAGAGAAETITLNCPMFIALDHDGYLFISEYSGSRLVGSGPLGFRCIGGCTGARGSTANQLSGSFGLSFDSDGNLFVTDVANHRIQQFVLAKNECLVSYNQPTLCPNATWNPIGITLANVSTLGNDAWIHTFVDTHDTIYVAASGQQEGQIRYNGSANPNLMFPVGSGSPRAIFADYDGNVYVEDGSTNRRVEKWMPDANRSETVMNVSGNCYSLFVDVLDNLYCSLSSLNQVLRRALNGNINSLTVVAGNLSSGSAADLLNTPRGIFVDQTLNLYVADCYNDRIQLFGRDQRTGITVAGNGSTGTILLNRPVGIVLDGNGYLFITDSYNHRIVGSGPHGFRCIISCVSSGSSTASSVLNVPRSLHFDSNGHLIVMSSDNRRLLKFFLSQNVCDQSTSTPRTDTSSHAATTARAPSLLSSSTQSLGSETIIRTTRRECPTSIATTEIPTDTSSHPTTIQTTTTVASISTAVAPTSCASSNTIGSYCNISTNPCDIVQPCLNNGTCHPAIAPSRTGYVCSCPQQFDGTQCENDHRLCQPDTCWNNGRCETLSNTTFECVCTKGWNGIHCEARINYCQNVECENGGVCHSMLGFYTCECLGESYSGPSCEVKGGRTRAFEVIATSFAYVAIIALTTFAAWIVVMDILKYAFKIDPVRRKRRQRGRRRNPTRRKRMGVVTHYTYVP